MMARFSGFGSSLPPNQLKKYVVKVGPPLTKLYGSAHARAFAVRTFRMYIHVPSKLIKEGRYRRKRTFR